MPVSRKDLNYYDSSTIVDFIKDNHIKYLINAAGYTGKPNVDACENDKHNTLMGNAVLPGILREACERAEILFGHVSSGCIYSGKKDNGDGFIETDKPNFSFRTNNSSFYSGTKALGEEILKGAENCYIWRLRIPFNEVDSPRNFITKLLNYDKLLEAENSISHLGEFTEAAWESINQEIKPGIYNITNTGSVKTSEVVEMIKEILNPKKQFCYFSNEEEFMKLAAKTPRSNCVLDNSKLLDAGIHVSSAKEAIEGSLLNWSRGQ